MSSRGGGGTYGSGAANNNSRVGGGDEPSAVAAAARPVDGWYGWIVTLAAFFCYFWVWGGFYAFSVLFSALQAEFHATHAQIAWILSLYPAVLQFVSILTGALAQRLGPRPVVFLGALLYGGGYFASSFAQSVYVMYFTYGLMVAMGSSCLVVATISTTGQYFKKHRNLAMGLVTAGSGTGSLILSQVVNAIQHHYNWRVVLRVMAVASLVTNIAASCVIVRRQKPKKRASFKTAFLCDPVFICLFSAMPLMYFGYWCFNVYMATYAETQVHMNSSDTSLAVSLFGVVNTVGRVMLGLIADRVSVTGLFSASILLKALCTFFLGYTTTPTTYWIVAMACGFFSAGGQMLPNVSAQHFPVKYLPSIVGFMYTCAGVASLLGSPVMGILIDNEKSAMNPHPYRIPCLVVSAVMAASAIPVVAVLCAAKRPRKAVRALEKEASLARDPSLRVSGRAPPLSKMVGSSRMSFFAGSEFSYVGDPTVDENEEDDNTVHAPLLGGRGSMRWLSRRFSSRRDSTRQDWATASGVHGSPAPPLREARAEMSDRSTRHDGALRLKQASQAHDALI